MIPATTGLFGGGGAARRGERRRGARDDGTVRRFAPGGDRLDSSEQVVLAAVLGVGNLVAGGEHEQVLVRHAPDDGVLRDQAPHHHEHLGARLGAGFGRLAVGLGLGLGLRGLCLGRTRGLGGVVALLERVPDLALDDVVELAGQRVHVERALLLQRPVDDGLDFRCIHVAVPRCW